MKIKTRHTPEPWETGGVMTRVEVRPEGWNVPMCIADCRTRNAPESEAERVANAAFIVQACNAHAALVAALEALNAGLQDGSIRFTKRRKSDSDPYHPANVLMCAALEKASECTK